MSEQVPLDDTTLADYLKARGVLPAGEELSVELAGDGNINWVRRARARRSGHSWIVKQARPALERFPEYRTSTERIVFEARYYESVARFDRGGVCPRVHDFDAEQRVLVLEDLAPAERLDRATARGADAGPAARRLGSFLGAVHAGTSGAAARELLPRFANGEMQRLHGDHVFLLPYRENDFPLPPVLRRRARALWDQLDLVERIDAAYARYLDAEDPDNVLVHGDVQSANILLAPAGPRLLDAEIAHLGDPAFDLGTLTAHLLLPFLARADPAGGVPSVREAWDGYAAARGPGAPPFARVARYAGIELLRRTVGAARVAAVADEATSLTAVAAGVAWVLRPPAHPEGLV